ncbi:YhjD/YihY/BrkB family envelope integrity protein [Nocardioides sp. W7]|uniref:YhjD/YihY/BrkB family envelope integrity protein n=1 Tax=Nocardioides sp. W7 TaxID=2931390 RepID=UPI001FD4CFF8|nr:YhjD/YihY/BrkB family envelope integrity protein [Nocardioides sp. W7]
MMSERLHRVQTWLRTRWLGRIVVNGLDSFLRLDMFDRSMTIAAQFFTSVFPILILLATWAASRDTHEIADAMGIPDETRSVLEDAIQGSGSASFGAVGVVIVLASATSLSRALIRAYMAIWAAPKPKSGLGSAWRWLAAVLVLTLALVAVRAASEPFDIHPLREALPLIATVTLNLAVALFVPWVLLAGEVRPRMLAPGAVLFALLMLTVRPATAAWLPNALEVSADRYGPIGVAFTYLACLYTASLCFLATAVLGQVIATDEGTFGQWIRRTRATKTEDGIAHSA